MTPEKYRQFQQRWQLSRQDELVIILFAWHGERPGRRIFRAYRQFLRGEGPAAIARNKNYPTIPRLKSPGGTKPTAQLQPIAPFIPIHEGIQVYVASFQPSSLSPHP